MSLFFRAQERRDFGAPPPIPKNSEQGYSVRRVNLSTTEGAMQKVAIASSVRLIASVMTMLPLDIFSGTGADKREVPQPRWLGDLGADGHGLEDWMWRGLYCWGLRGNIIGTIVDRDVQSGKPRAIDMHHPDDVSVHREGGDTGRPVWLVKGNEVPRERIYHRRIFPVPGCIKGASPIAQHALTIGSGLAAEQFGAQFFLDGGHPTAIFQNKVKTLDGTKSAAIKERFKAVLSGNREPIVLGSDWDYRQIQVSPNDSQFLETGRYTNAECARIYGPGMPEILGYETGGSMTYANIEQRATDLLTFTLDPWLVRMERLLTALLPNPQYAKFQRKALLRTDLLTRFQAHEIAIRNAFEVVNEVREIEDMSPVEWGDKPPENPTVAPTPVTLKGP